MHPTSYVMFAPKNADTLRHYVMSFDETNPNNPVATSIRSEAMPFAPSIAASVVSWLERKGYNAQVVK